MRQDPENGKDSDLGWPAADTAPSSPLAAHSALVERLFTESGASSWGLSRDRFRSALERCSVKQFGSAVPAPGKLEQFLSALHLGDLALACACAQGSPEAWDHFVAVYRAYLRSAAAALLHCSANEPAACELADSLFADLYRLQEGNRAERSLFRYFHGRSSLKTWLRAVLAQRHIDAIRSSRRFTVLNEENDSSARQPSHAKALIQDHESPPDPHRGRYVCLLASALEGALASLDPRDRERLRLHYREQQTLAEIGRALGEHESSVSRNLGRIRRQLRRNVEAALRHGHGPVDGTPSQPGLSDQQIALCFQYASEDAPIDLERLLPRLAEQLPKPTRRQP
jgi:RNA polymerase sigma-70 factor